MKALALFNLVLESLVLHWWILPLCASLAFVVWLIGDVAGGSCHHYDIDSARIACAHRQKSRRAKRGRF